MKQEVTRTGEFLRDLILGGQDGIVNVLGIILGVATATRDQRFIIVAGLSALFAESISMGAVAFTSTKASRDYYAKQVKNKKDRTLLNGGTTPLQHGWSVLLATIIGSIIPLVPFFFTSDILLAALIALTLSGVALFLVGYYKAQLTFGSHVRSGVEMVAIGLIAAIAGFVIGEVLQWVFY